MQKHLRSTVTPFALAALIPLGAGAQESGELVYRDAAVGNDCVWLAADQGLVRFDKMSGEKTLITSESFTNLTSVTIAPDGKVYAGAYGHAGVATVEDGEFSPIPIEGTGLQNVSALCYGDGLWAGGSHILAKYTTNDWSVYESPNPAAANLQYTSIVYDAETGNTWFGIDTTARDKKLGWVDASGQINFVVDAVQNVNDLAVTGDGTVLLATDKGMMKYAEGALSIFEHPVSSIPQGCSAVGAEGADVYFGAGYTLVKGTGNAFRAYPCREVENTDHIVSIIPEGNMAWVTFEKGGLYVFCDGVFEIPTAVEGIIADDIEADTRIYDLRGYQVRNLIPGSIYIRGGKKFVAK